MNKLPFVENDLCRSLVFTYIILYQRWTGKPVVHFLANLNVTLSKVKGVGLSFMRSTLYCHCMEGTRPYLELVYQYTTSKTANSMPLPSYEKKICPPEKIVNMRRTHNPIRTCTLNVTTIQIIQSIIMNNQSS